ncbi:HD domain-containing phosphohydrolase [Methyloversatilis thermotolerans]|uniref:HD domain-containing phosphohydrolase n=1 Tax=Methyloversatilis thermotolerans TaxID=1346290 RepID=UPI000366230F|nr:HD domain-containing phosphohydrolase [Methyloversatilis thermotolerans]
MNMNDTSQLQPASTGDAIAPLAVLCVDDERGILSSLRRLLRPLGHQVHVAESAAEALGLLETTPVDLVISDMRMPEMDGAEFLARVRARWPQPVRVLLTGYSDLSSTIDAINRGEIHRFVSKPWDDEHLLSVVRDGLSRRMLEREREQLRRRIEEQNQELLQMNVLLEEKVEARTAELALANDHLKQNFLTSIKVFSNLIEIRHPVLKGHSRRVSELARTMARLLNLPQAQINEVFAASLLHDIGKIGLSDEVIAQPSDRLVGEPLKAWRAHAALGESALLALDSLRASARIIRHHHERYDGKGFPDGLQGEAIPLGARILAVANDFDSYMHGLVCGTRHSEDESFDYIARGRGSRYDAAVVEALSAALAEEANARLRDDALPVDKLEPGMVLSRDLVDRDGRLLLAADFRMDGVVIRQIRDYASRVNPTMKVHVHPPVSKAS